MCSAEQSDFLLGRPILEKARRFTDLSPSRIATHTVDLSLLTTIYGFTFGDQDDLGNIDSDDVESTSLLTLEPGDLPVHVLVSNCSFMNSSLVGLTALAGLRLQVINSRAFGVATSIHGMLDGTSLQVSNFVCDGTLRLESLSLVPEGEDQFGTAFISNSMFGSIEAQFNQASLLFTNTLSNGLTLKGDEGRAKFSNCEFNIHKSALITGSNFYSLANCDFIIHRGAGSRSKAVTALTLAWPESEDAKGYISLASCQFLMSDNSDNIQLTDTFIGIVSVGTSSSQSELSIKDCRFGSGLHKGILFYKCGLRATIHGILLESRVGIEVLAHPTAEALLRIGHVKLSRLADDEGVAYLSFLSDSRRIKITHLSTTLTNEENIIHGPPIGLINSLGQRLIYGTSEPRASDAGLKGDIWRLTTPRVGQDYEWVCVQSGTSTSNSTQWAALSRIHQE